MATAAPGAPAADERTDTETDGRTQADSHHFLVIGLGNPGPTYEGTRHNIGRDFVRSFMAAQNLSFSTRVRGCVISNVGIPVTQLHLDWRLIVPRVRIPTSSSTMPPTTCLSLGGEHKESTGTETTQASSAPESGVDSLGNQNVVGDPPRSRRVDSHQGKERRPTQSPARGNPGTPSVAKTTRWDLNFLQQLSQIRMTWAIAETFMNLSGTPTRRLANELSIPPERIIVMFDDMDLPFGTIRVKRTGTAGGHRGVDSVIRELGIGPDQTLLRVRIGVGRPNGAASGKKTASERAAVVSWVLNSFDEREAALLSQIRFRALAAAIYLAACPFDRVQMLINGVEDRLQQMQANDASLQGAVTVQQLVEEAQAATSAVQLHDQTQFVR